MPGFVTHYLFGTAAISDTSSRDAKKIVQKHYRTYGLGLQGPDIFFYDLPVFLFHKENPGSVAHNNKTYDFLQALFRSLRLFSKQQEREIALTYCMGFLGHYTLDTVCHPYIYDKTRYDETDQTYFGRHVYLETDIDTELLARCKHLRPSEFHPERTIRLNRRERCVAAKCLHHAYRSVFPELNLSYAMIYTATLLMPFGVWFLHDPYGKKKAIGRMIERRVPGYPFVTPMIPSDRLRFTIDPLNRTHKKWHNPWNRQQTSNDSFDDLFELAKTIYLPRMEELIRTGHVKDLDNLSYSSGLPL